MSFTARHALSLLLLATAACAKANEGSTDSTTLAQGGGTLVARATILGTSGDSIGVATFDRTADGPMILLHVKGLPVGPHGVHLHMVGSCEPPEFTSAGGHFNPTGATHGAKSEKGPHAGDLPNFDIQQAEAGEHYQATTARVKANDGPDGLFDADGMASVIHAAADDETTDPTGNSGARIACGVITRAGCGGGGGSRGAEGRLTLAPPSLLGSARLSTMSAAYRPTTPAILPSSKPSARKPVF